MGLSTWVWNARDGRMQWYYDPAPLLGLPPGSFHGAMEDYLACVHPEDRPRSRAAYTDCLKGSRTKYCVEDRVVWPDGSTHRLEVSGLGSYGSDGRALRVAGVIRDVTGRYNCREKLPSETKYAAVFSVIPEPVVIARAGDTVVLEVNDAYERLMGVPRDLAVGRRMFELWVWEAPVDRDYVTTRLASDGRVINHPTRIVRADGKAIDVRLSATNVDLDGEPCVVWTWSDVTELRRAEAQARQSLRKFSTLFETHPDGIVVTRPREQRIVEINDAALRIAGITREQAVGVQTDRIVHWLDWNAHEQLRQRLLAGERVVNMPVPFRRPDGAVVEASMSGAVVALEGEAHFVISVRDVTEQRRVERALAENEGFFRAMFEQSAVGIAVRGIGPGNLRFLRVNQKLCEMLGYTRDELLQLSFLDLTLPEDRDRAFRNNEKLRRGEITSYTAEKGLLRRNGGILWTTVFLSAVRGADGVPTRVVSTIHDITERDRAEKDLRKSEQRFRAIFNHAGIGIALRDARDRHSPLMQVNDRFCEITGYTREEVLKLSAADITPPDGQDAAVRDTQRLLHGEINSYTREKRIVGKGGRSIWVAISVAALPDAEGRPDQLIASYQDITERKSAEEALQRSVQDFRAIFDQYAVGMALRDADPFNPRWIDVNRKLCDMLGYTREELLQRTLLDVTPPEDRGAMMENNRRLLQGEIAHVLREKRYLHKSGRIVWANMVITPVRGPDGKPIHLVTVIEDITERKYAESALAKSEARLRATLHNTPGVAVQWFDRSGRVRYWNPASEKLYRVRAVEAMGKPLHELIRMPLQEREFLDLLAASERNGGAHTGEMTIGCRDGTDVNVLYSLFMIPGENGEPNFVCMDVDITALKCAVQAQRESEERTRLIIETAPDAVISIDVEGRIMGWNPQAESTFGWKREEAVGCRLSELIVPAAYRERHEEGLRRHAETGEALMVNRRIELPALRRDGVEFPAELTITPMGTASGMTFNAFVRDITERKRRERQLIGLAQGVSPALGTAFFESLASYLSRELAADYVLIGELLPENRRRARSLAFCKDGGLAPSIEYALEGAPWEEAINSGRTVIYPQHVSALFPKERQLRDLSVESYVGTPLIGSDGAPVGILIAMSRERITRLSQWVAILEIVAVRAASEIERARAETRVRELNASLERRVADRTAELEVANRELDAFSYSVSHDLRSPLQIIVGLAEIVRDVDAKILPAKVLHCIERIEHNARKLDRLIDALLGFSHSIRIPLSRSMVDMRALVDGVIRDLEEDRPTHARLLIGELPPARGDAALLRQVWTNLIGNALKFSRAAAEPLIEIGGEARGDVVEYLVRDNGAGFPASHGHRLFAVFQRLHSESEFEGTGVGLALAKRIVERHGGTVSAEGAPGQGAAFRFTLPVSSAPN